VLAAGRAGLGTPGNDVCRARVAVIAIRGTALGWIAGLSGIDFSVPAVGNADAVLRIARHPIIAVAAGSSATVVTTFAPLAARRAAIRSTVATAITVIATIVASLRRRARERTALDRLCALGKAANGREREHAEQQPRYPWLRDRRDHDALGFRTGGLVISVYTRTSTSVAT